MEVPEFFQAAGFCLPENRQIHYPSSESKPLNAAGDHFAVEDLFDFSNEDAVLTDAAIDAAAHSADSSTVTVADASFLPPDAAVGPRNNIADNGNGNGNFSGELGVPYEDLAELEWLSSFVEESFSSEDLEKLQLISGHHARPETPRNNPIFDPDVAVPGKARSKRSRAAAPCRWSSPLIALSPATSSSEPDGTAAAAPPQAAAPPKKAVKAKKESSQHDGGGGEGRKCVHCATDKTPQWRTGPMGPKTLCNACGVRYKSGRLVPEYRPASSPTFVLTKHSNSHRKVMELRRQKEMQMAQQQQQFMHHHHQNMMFDVTNGDDYLIHHPDFRQLI